MSVNIIHTADLHLSWAQYNLRERVTDFEQSVTQITDYAVKNKVNAVIWAGDVFDSNEPRPRSVEFMRHEVAKLTACGISSLGVQGNHDRDWQSGSWLKVCGIHELEDGRVVDIDGLRIAGWGYRKPESTLALLESYRPDAPVSVAVLHQALLDACPFANPAFTVEAVTAALKPHGVRYVAMGDIHRACHFSANGIHVAYPGSIEMTDANEELIKSFLHLTFNGQELVNTQALTLRTRPVVKVLLNTVEEVDAFMSNIPPPPNMLLLAVANTCNHRLPELHAKMIGRSYRLETFTGKVSLQLGDFSWQKSMSLTERLFDALEKTDMARRDTVRNLLSGHNAVELVKEYMEAK